MSNCSMERNVLILYLKKLAEGDKSYISKVCQRLADKLIFAPANQVSKDQQLIFQVATFQDEYKSYVNIFTSEKLLKEWSKVKMYESATISVLGADFCSALDVNTWIKIDEGSPHEVMIDPEIIDEIACAPFDEQAFVNEETVTV
jgi:hypothetical protein